MNKVVKISGTGLTANTKKLLLEVIKVNNEKYFGKKLKVNRTNMMVEKLESNQYKVTEYLNRPSIVSGGTYEKTFETIVEVK